MQRNELTEGPILPALLKFCWPVLVALFLQSLYGAVDLMVVGRFGDAADILATVLGRETEIGIDTCADIVAIEDAA